VLKFGFYTSVLGDVPLTDVATFAKSAGFETLEIDIRNHLGDLGDAESAVDTVRGAGLEVCALTSWGPILDADRDAATAARERLADAVRAAGRCGVDIVAGFAGRDSSIDEDSNYAALAECLRSIAAEAAEVGVRLVLENWPGLPAGWCATTPAGWRRLFASVPASNLGLNLDPSHLVWQGIDHVVALKEFCDRVFLTHAKDTEIYPDRLQSTGYFNPAPDYGSNYWMYRLPGHGVVDWTLWLQALLDCGYDGVVSIEHEDTNWGAFGGPVDRRQAGLVEGLSVLRRAAARRDGGSRPTTSGVAAR